MITPPENFQTTGCSIFELDDFIKLETAYLFAPCTLISSDEWYQ